MENRYTNFYMVRSTLKWQKLKLIFMVCFVLLSTVELKAQSAVTGTVTSSEDGSTLPGVSIIIEGTASGTVTDIDGKYSIMASEGDILVASFVGFKPLSATVGSLSVIDFNLEVDVDVLEEVVVIGYGAIDKADVTTAISSIDQESIRNLPVSGIDQAIQGKVAGVTVSTNGGQPGGGVSVRVRGITSVGNNEPLYVIDGVPMVGTSESLRQDFLGGGNGQTTQSALSRINPSDIESIDILKDASAQAIYGSRAANGVVLVTTKKGKMGEGKITYDTYYGRQFIPKKLDVMNLQENAQYQIGVIDEINAVDGGSQTISEELSDPSILGHGTDWQDEIYQPGTVSSHLVSFSGGQNKTNYYFSLGAFNQTGTLIGTDFERFTLRGSVDHDVKDWLTAGFSTNLSRSDQRIGLADAFDAVTSVVLYNSPLAPVKDANGDYVGQIQVGSTNYGNASNPVAQAELRDVRQKENKVFGAIYGEIKFMKGLSLRNELNYDITSTEGSAFQPYVTNELFNTDIITPSKLREQRNDSWFYALKNYLSYNKSFGDHNVYVTVGHEAQRSSYNYISASRNNLTLNLPSLAAGSDENQAIDAGAGDWSMESYFGRFNYSYLGKYAISATLRADGSSSFGSENRWGYFPAVSASWTISNEPFMSNNGVISFAKLRAGYGEVGNQDIDARLYVANVSLISPSAFPVGSRLYNVPNPQLGWESVKTTNIGLDLGIWNGRLDMSLDLYQKVTSDMLLQGQFGAFSGMGSAWDDLQSPTSNAGQMTNKGIDLSLTTVNIDKAFKWSSTLVFSKYKNHLDYLNTDEAQIPGLFDEYGTKTLVSLTRAGYPVGVYYGYVTDGLYTSEEELNALETGLDVAPDALWLGDIKYKDLDNDGDIDDEDVTVIGDPNPDFTLGFTNTLSYKGFDLSVFLYGSFGGDIFNYTRRQTEAMNTLYNNQLTTVLDRYTATNEDATMPRYNQWHNNNLRISDRYIEDGTYLRVQNIQLGYTLPAEWAKKVLMSSFKVYVSAQNLLTFTNYSGYDPELGSLGSQDDGNGILLNVDNGRYPVPRSFTIGANIEF